MDCDAVMARFQVGEGHMVAGRNAEASAAFQQVIAMDDTMAPAYLNAACVEMGLGNDAVALNLLQQGLPHAVDSAVAASMLVNMGHIVHLSNKYGPVTHPVARAVSHAVHACMGGFSFPVAGLMRACSITPSACWSARCSSCRITSTAK